MTDDKKTAIAFRMMDAWQNTLGSPLTRYFAMIDIVQDGIAICAPEAARAELKTCRARTLDEAAAEAVSYRDLIDPVTTIPLTIAGWILALKERP